MISKSITGTLNLLKLLLVTCVSFASFDSASQIVSNNAFLQGNHVEVAVGPCGAFASTVAAPAGYHPRSPFGSQLGFVADPAKDGWTVGSPNYVGDYFLPGSPEEGWGMSINGLNYNNNQICNETTIPGSITNYTNTATQVSGTWQGNIGGLSITARTYIPKNSVYFVTEVTVVNTSASTINNVYYMRNVDPDHGVFTPGAGGDYTTSNQIVFQNPSSCNTALVSSTTLSGGNYLGLGSIDSRARVTHGGFSNRNAQQVWSGSGLFSSGSAVQDAAISISFNLGNLSPNQSTSFAYAYILSSADLNNALAATNINFNVNGTSYLTGNTASVCSGTGVPISLTNTGTFTTWNWSPSTGLNTTTGTNVVSTVTSPITYTVTGTGPCGSVTLSISLNPVNVPSVGNAGVISGPTSISLGQANNTFSISPVSNATGYTWTLPPGAVVVGSSTSNTITFNASNISWCGPITVTPFNSCYTGASSSKNICVGNQLTTGSIPTSLCPGQSISVNYTASGIFNAGNTFTAQLSNSSGSFATPTNIGSITSTALSGTITSSIPASIPVGTGYRIRIVSSNLVGVGSDNGANISIGGLPTITCGSNLNLSSDPGLCASLVTYAAPVATSPCTGSPTNLIVNGGFESGNLTGWVAVDNPVPFLPWQVQSSFSYFNTVTPIEGSKCAGNGFDGNTGVASLSQQVTLPSSGSSILSWKENLQYNIFSGYLPRTYEVRITNASGSILETLYSFTANAGISTNNAWVNQSFDVSAYNGQTVKIVFWQNIPQNYTGPGRFALDDVRLINTPSSATVIQTSGLPSGSLFPVGVTTNTFVATDLYGNTASCAFNVTISDNEDPVITCPNDISVLGSSAAGTVVSYDSPVVFDNCGLTTLIQSAGLNSGSLFPLGTTTNVFQTTDASGNTATCSFNVSVTGVPPSIVCPGTINSSTDPGQCSASVTFAATEVIGIPASTITYSASSGSNFNQGNTLVTATAVNAVGSSSCSFTINVTDNENPVVNCPANITLPTCIDQATWPLNASDNCGISSIVSVPASGSNFPVGITPVVITATDVNGNTSSCSFTVSRSAPLSVSAIVGNIACNGGTTSVTVSASGGTAPYTGVGTFTVSAGSYSYTVTDANGCTASTSATVTEPSVLTVGIVGSDYNGYGVSCYQSTDGSADATANGGVSGYSYSWSNGSTSEDLSGLAAGSYSVTVTDANGCSAGETVVLVEPTKVNISATNTAIACFGGNSTVTVTTWGGALQYQVNDAGTYSVPAGSYTYNVVDANGCSASTDITIGQPALLVASTSTSDYNGYGLSCNGGSNGEVMVSATGGTAPYSGTGNNAGLSAGSYSYTVTDANGCSSTVSATITEPSVLTVGIVGSDYNGYGVSCYQSTDGSADATANGGVGGYSYSWSNGSTSEDLSGLAAGSYSVTVTDANGCTAGETVVLAEPTKVNISATNTAIACNGGNSDVTVTTWGGVNPYIVDEAGVYSVPAGTYTYNVEDANGCSASTTIDITQPALLTVDAGSDETVFLGYGPMQCADLNATVNGGTPAYSVVWTSTASGGGVGSAYTACPTSNESYTVSVVDANGCTASDQLSICVVDVTCYAGNSSIQKVEMCQIPPGNPANAHTICVDANAVPAHLAIGCQLGACGELAAACSGPAAKNMEADLLSAALTAYPNPTENTTTISVTLTKAGNYSVEMYDMMGKLVKTVYAGSFEEYENLEFDVDMTNLNTGVYMISVSNGDQKIENIRVMKN